MSAARSNFPANIVIRRGRSSYVVNHCGHPTALWPYSIIRHDGQLIVAPCGLGFQTQLKAVAAALLISSKRMPIYAFPENQRHCAGWQDVARSNAWIEHHLDEARAWLVQHRKHK